MDQSIHVYLDHVNMSYPASIYNATTLKQEIFARLRLQKRKELLRDVEALKDYTLHIENGEHVGVIGHNGSGKSTLLKTIAGVYPVVSGTVDVKGTIHSLFDLGLGLIWNQPDVKTSSIEDCCWGPRQPRLRQNLRRSSTLQILASLLITPSNLTHPVCWYDLHFQFPQV